LKNWNGGILTISEYNNDLSRKSKREKIKPRELPEKISKTEEGIKYKKRTIDVVKPLNKSSYRTRRVVFRHLNPYIFIPCMIVGTILLFIIYYPSIPTFIFALCISIFIVVIIIMKYISLREGTREKKNGKSY